MKVLSGVGGVGLPDTSDALIFKNFSCNQCAQARLIDIAALIKIDEHMQCYALFCKKTKQVDFKEWLI